VKLIQDISTNAYHIVLIVLPCTRFVMWPSKNNNCSSS